MSENGKPVARRGRKASGPRALVAPRIAGSNLARLALALVLATSLAACGGGSGGAGQDAPASGPNTEPAPPPVTPSVTPPPPSPSPPPVTPPANHAPTIAPAPITTATIGQLYTFQPTASDADGDRLTFAIINKPDWATFNTGTGRLVGTPDASTGALLTVPISVSDGKATASMDLRIDVVEPTVGSVTLRWQAPLTNEDGTPLTDLAGYVIRYGLVKSALDQSVQVNDSGATSYTVGNLTAGKWFFTMTSVNSSGTESKPTGYVSKTIG